MAEENTINFADLEDFSDTTRITENSNVYAVLFRKTGPKAKTAYKFNLRALNSYFLVESEIASIKTKIKNMRDAFDSIIDSFQTMDYLLVNDYILKYDAEKNRKKLATEESMKAILSDYMSHLDLETDKKEADAHAMECASSYTISMAGTAVRARSTNSSNNLYEKNATSMATSLKTLASKNFEINVSGGGGGSEGNNNSSNNG